MISFPVGIATTMAVALHEIPQEIGDYGVLLRGGFSRGKALLLNFASAFTAACCERICIVVRIILANSAYFFPIAVGGFIYIAGSDLIPELHKELELPGRLCSLCFSGRNRRYGSSFAY